MLKHKNVLQLIIFTFAKSLSQVALAAAHAKMAEMKLDNALSSLSFVSVKKGTAGEAHHIRKLSGSISASGELKVMLNLASVDSKIDIRNERIKKHLFETATHPTATITANIGSEAPTGVTMVTGEGILDMHGVTTTIPVNVIIANTGDKLVIASATPIIIKASDYGMEAGVKKLQELAKLPSVATAIPVSFTFTFSK